MHTTNSARENREISWPLAADGGSEPQGEGQGRNPEMNGHEKSHGRVVPTKPGNKTARTDKTTRFTTLLHHVTPELLEQAYRGLKRNAAAGIDGKTWKDYGEQLAGNLADLHGRI